MTGGGAAELKPHSLKPHEAAPKRPIEAISLAGVEPGMSDVERPTFEDVDPTSLLIDSAYQRNLSEAGARLVRKIIRDWDWRRFKPPIVARTDAGLEVIDGQHTALAAATHPLIDKIPVMIVRADSQESRASAFIGQNRDRLGITPMQMHFAAVAAGDDEAATVAQVCERAGVTVLRATRAGGAWNPRETVAVSAIGVLINRLGAQKARICLQVLAEADCAPISAAQIKAVQMLLHEEEYAGEIDPADLTTAVMACGDQAAQDAAVFAAAHKVPLWRALGIVWFRKARHGRRRAR